MSLSMKIAVLAASGVSMFLVGCGDDSNSTSTRQHSVSLSTVNSSPTVIGNGSVRVGGGSDGFVSVDGEKIKANPGDSVTIGEPGQNTHIKTIDTSNANNATVDIY